MPYKGDDWQPTRGEGAAPLLDGRYGEENDDRVSELVDFENGVRKFWADRLTAYAEEWLYGDEREGAELAASLLDPYSGLGAEFGRTLAAGPPGAVTFVPEK